MGYFNAILVLIIAFQIGKLYVEYKEMEQARNAKKGGAINLRASASQMK